MIDYSLLRLIPAEESHNEFSFHLKEVAYKDYIDEIFGGWNDNTAKEYHANDILVAWGVWRKYP